MFHDLARTSANNSIHLVKPPPIEDAHVTEEQLRREYRGLVATLLLNMEKY